jgi:ribosomal 50S subunit-associated protein YjgA (DUF615 family)
MALTQTDIDVARKALNKVKDGDNHYYYLLDRFIDTVEKGIKEGDGQIPYLLRKT